MIKNIELFDGKKAEILDIYGYNDGFYWDYQIIFKVEAQEYTINVAGSYSGWIATYDEITINKEPSKLSGVTYNFNNIDAVPEKDIIVDVQQFYKKFIESGAQINYVYAEDEDGKCYTHVDGVKKMTNAEKFEEIFGIKIEENYPAGICKAVSHDICEQNNCDECPAYKFWDREYKKPVKSCTDD